MGSEQLDIFRQTFSNMLSEVEAFKLKEAGMTAALKVANEAKEKALQEAASLRETGHELERNLNQKLFTKTQEYEQKLNSISEHNRHLQNELAIEREKVKTLSAEQSAAKQEKEHFDQELKKWQSEIVRSDFLNSVIVEARNAFERLKQNCDALGQEHQLVKSEMSKLAVLEDDYVKVLEEVEKENIRLKNTVDSMNRGKVDQQSYESRVTIAEQKNLALTKALAMKERDLQNMLKTFASETERYNVLLKYLDESIQLKLVEPLKELEQKPADNNDEVVH